MTHFDDLYADARRPHRRRSRWLLAVLALVLVASGTAFAITGPLKSSDDHPATATTAPPPTVKGAPAPPTSKPVSTACRRPLLSDDPLRLWIGGDSLAGSLGPSLGALTGTTGVVQPTFNSRVSSGLASPEFYDWPKHVVEDLFRYNPEVVVFMIGTNDAKALPQNAGDDPKWKAQYSTLVEEMLDELIGNGRTVYWVGAPVVKDRDFSERVEMVNAVFQQVVAKHPKAHYIDAYKLLADPEGRFTTTLPDSDGNEVLIRAGDGVHLTPEGGDRVAAAVFAELNPYCKITAQAVPNAVKQTVEVQGSSQIPGTRRTDTGSPPPETTVTETTVSPSTTSLPTATSVPQTTPSTGTRPPISTPTPPSQPCTKPPCHTP